jgi:hypothetical protein
MLVVLAAPRVLLIACPAALEPDKWWMTIPMVLLAAAFYSSSLKRAGAMLLARREKMLAIVEGRS